MCSLLLKGGRSLTKKKQQRTETSNRNYHRWIEDYLVHAYPLRRTGDSYNTINRIRRTNITKSWLAREEAYKISADQINSIHFLRPTDPGDERRLHGGAASREIERSEFVNFHLVMASVLYNQRIKVREMTDALWNHRAPAGRRI